jgi:hypothetical protein
VSASVLAPLQAASPSRLRRTLRWMRHNPMLSAGVITVGALVLVAVFAPLLAPSPGTLALRRTPSVCCRLPAGCTCLALTKSGATSCRA